METMTLWMMENFGLFLLLAFLLSVGVLASCVAGAWRLIQRRSWSVSRFVRLALLLVVGLAGLLGTARFGFGIVEVWPVLRAQGELLDEPAPGFDFTTIDGGQAASLEEHQGRVVLLNLWATWCPPCREEMPELDRLQQTFDEQGLVVVLISDEEGATVEKYLRAHPMAGLHGVVDAMPWPEFGRPTTYLIDRDGIVREIFQGARTFDQFSRLVSSYL